MAKFWESWSDWDDNDEAASEEVSSNGGYGSTGSRTRHAWNAATQRAVEIVKRHTKNSELVNQIRQGLDRPTPYRRKQSKL